MQRFYCPECGEEIEVAPRYGGEIVSVYCVKHKSGTDGHTQPVYMTRVSAAETAPAREAEPALV